MGALLGRVEEMWDGGTEGGMVGEVVFGEGDGVAGMEAGFMEVQKTFSVESVGGFEGSEGNAWMVEDFWFLGYGEEGMGLGF